MRNISLIIMVAWLLLNANAVNSAVASKTIQLAPITINDNQNILSAFRVLKLDFGQLDEILNAPYYGLALLQLLSGDVVVFEVNENNIIVSVQVRKKSGSGFKLVRRYFGFQAVENEYKTHSTNQTKYYHTTINASVSASLREGDLPKHVTDILLSCLSERIDFTRDIHSGDTLQIVYSSDKKKPVLLAAKLDSPVRSRSAEIYMVRENYYLNENGEPYASDGRLPVQYTKISSIFSAARNHPILHMTKPHLGIDLVAEEGTPVVAVLDGIIKEASEDSKSGKYVIVEHSNLRLSKYLHLNSVNVKAGELVKAGQQIGAVGETGLATGPHLHFEWLIDSVHKDPSIFIEEVIAKRKYEGKGLGVESLSYVVPWRSHSSNELAMNNYQKKQEYYAK